MFRKLYEAFAEMETYDADANLTNLSGVIEADWLEYQCKHTLKDICDNLGTDELTVKVYEILKDSTVQEAITYAIALGNAVKQCRFNKTKMLKVGDLDIQLL